MARGIKPSSLGPITFGGSTTTSVTQGIPWMLCFTSAASTSTYNWLNDTRHKFLVTRCWGYLTGTVGAGDTAKVSKVSAGTAYDITDTADFNSSGMLDTYQFDFSVIDDQYNEISPGQYVRLTTASDALCKVFVEGFWKE